MLRRVLIISGSMGAGKSSVMGEASDCLLTQQHVHATIDLDAVGIHLLPEQESERLHYLNLANVYANCIDAGIRDFLVAAAIENRDVLKQLHQTFHGSQVTVCRLLASEPTMQQRLAVRETGMRRSEFLGRSRLLDEVLTNAALEDFVVENDGRNVTEVAREVLLRAGWIRLAP